MVCPVFRPSATRRCRSGATAAPAAVSNRHAARLAPLRPFARPHSGSARAPPSPTRTSWPGPGGHGVGGGGAAGREVRRGDRPYGSAHPSRSRPAIGPLRLGWGAPARAAGGRGPARRRPPPLLPVAPVTRTGSRPPAQLLRLRAVRVRTRGARTRPPPTPGLGVGRVPRACRSKTAFSRSFHEAQHPLPDPNEESNQKALEGRPESLSASAGQRQNMPVHATPASDGARAVSPPRIG